MDNENSEIEIKETKEVKKEEKKRLFGKKFGRIAISAGAVLLSCLVTFMTTYNVMQNAHRSEIAKLAESYSQKETTDETLEYMKSIVGEYFYGDDSDWQVSDGDDAAYRSYAESLNDAYTEYMSPEEYAEHTESMSGNFVGIGILATYSADESAIVVLLPISGSPAEKAGIKKGDYITAVDGKTVAELGYSAAIDAVKGESGTTVSLTVLRDDIEKEITVERAAVEGVSVIYKLSQNNRTAIITITQFDEMTPVQFEAAIESAVNDGATEIVFDLRGNPGGSLESVLSVLSYILPKDSTLIRIISKDGEVTTRESDSEHTVDLPMAILINGSSASAAELFTSCLRDYDKAVIVGTKSYGKGCMQTIFPLPNGGAFKITTRVFTPPKGESYHGIGIYPDVTVEACDKLNETNKLLIDENDDNQLQAAISALLENK